MLNLGNYIPSSENFDDAIPSPLMDGDAAPVLPGDDLGNVQVVEDLSALPVEDIVELPPELDPTPLQPLEAPIVQEEVIAVNEAAAADQLLGAQITLEGYSQLLRSSGKNMTRQSAAFMAVGMRRANRLLGVTSLGLENEDSGTQVMAMKQASVDKEGLGSKIRQAAAKVWEWLKAQYAKMKGLYGKLREALKPKKEQVAYLIAATEAVKSGNPAKVKALPAPSGLSVSQVLDAIHADKKAPEQKTVSLPAALVPFVTKNGKLDLSISAEHEFRSKGAIEWFRDATALTVAVTAALQTWTKDTTAEEVADTVSDLVKKHLSGKPAKWEMHGMIAERTAEGVITATPVEADEAVNVPLPSLDELTKFLKDIDRALGQDEVTGIEVGDKYQAAGEAMMDVAEKLETKIGQDKAAELGNALARALKMNDTGSLDSGATKAMVWLDKVSSKSIKAVDFFLTHYLGKGNTVSQEDFEALPSRGLSVVPGQSASGIGSRIVSGAKEAWRKVKAFFLRLWQQFRDGLSKLWERIFGGEKQVDMLLLTNEAVPDEGQAPSGQPLALPPGTGLKSVAAAKALSGPSASDETPAEVVSEPVDVSGQALPKGFIYTDSLKKLKLSSGYAFEPTIEENLIAWFTNSYNPAVIKMWRDVTSMANSNFDVGAFDTWGKVLTDMAAKVMAGAPVGEIPGGQSLVLNEGTIAFSFGGGSGTDSEPVKALNKRQIAQILARQKRAYRGLEVAQKATEEQERLHVQFSAVIERLINSADDAKGQQYSAFYTAVNRLMCNTAVRQLATTIGSRFTARTDVMDEMIAARAKRG